MKTESFEEKGAKLGESGRAEVFEGVLYSFYLQRDLLSEEEAAIANFLVSFANDSYASQPMEIKANSVLSKEFLVKFQEKIVLGVSFSYGVSKFLEEESFSELKRVLAGLFREFVPGVSNFLSLSETVLDYMFGYGKLSSLIRDQGLEEIMVNGFEKSVFVYHQVFGMCKTNIVLSADELMKLTKKIASNSGKVFDESHPFLDARLPIGHRVNATFSSVTLDGVSLTIRKFTPIPLSIINLISNNTVSSEAAAFLWAMVEGINISPMNLIVTGGAGSGKTTTLNVLTSFVNRRERIITIEDPVELNLGKRDNWVQMEPSPIDGVGTKHLMDALLQNSFRMRPDRIIVGEVRGEEAQTLFVAMDVGHEGCMGTLHANTARETLLRLSKDPMNVPEVMIPLLDIIVVQYRMYVKGKGVIRRVTQIAEVSSMEGKPLIGVLFEWDRKTDRLRRTDIPSHLIEEFSDKILSTKKDVLREINVRKKVLEWLISKNISSAPDVEEIIQRYYFDQQSVLKMVLKDFKPGQADSF